MKFSRILGILVMACLLLILPLLTACESDETEDPEKTEVAPTEESTPVVEPTEESPPTQTPEPTEEAELKSWRNPDFPEGYQNPLDHLPVPHHPFLAPNGMSNMHCDAYMSDTYEISGPLGINTQATRVPYGDGVNMCVTIAFDSKGRILTTNARETGYKTLLIDPDTMEELASYDHPPRRSDWPKDPLYPYGNTAGGAYFILDNEDRAVFSTFADTVQVIQYSDAKGEFELVREYDLKDHLVPKEPPAKDYIQMALPDWSGRYWFTTRHGIIGTIDPDTGEVHSTELAGEQTQNSFTIGEDGVYIVTDYAMYRFNSDDDGTPVVDWRTEYDRGSRVKPSMFLQGSGQSPQLFGDFIAIGDNADPKMNVLFLNRSDGSLACQIPVFDDDISATENAFPGFVREGPNGLEYLLIVKNDYGKDSNKVFGTGGCCVDSVGGIVRIDLIPDGKGGFACEEVWSSPENSCSTLPKLSLGNGLLYLHTYQPLVNDDYGYYFTAVDFETGETVFRIPTGTGLYSNDFGAPITLAPDGGTAFMGCFGGIITIKDNAP